MNGNPKDVFANMVLSKKYYEHCHWHALDEKGKAVPENLQAFGSTQKRLASDAVTPAERQPGA